MQHDEYLDVPFKDYLSDRDYVTNSMLKHMKRSPAHMKAYIDKPSQEPTAALIKGRAAHCMVLEEASFDREYFLINDDLKALTKPQIEAIAKGKGSDLALERQAEWDELHKAAKGRELIRFADVSDVIYMREALMEVPKIKALLTIGKAEQTLYWTDDETEIMCKMRADFVHGSEQSVLVDYKTCEDASSEGFNAAFSRYMYHIQAAHYMAGGQAQHFYFIAQEKTPPYAARLYLADDYVIQQGERWRRTFLNQLKMAQELGQYPSYNTDTEIIDLKPWAIKPHD